MSSDVDDIMSQDSETVDSVLETEDEVSEKKQEVINEQEVEAQETSVLINDFAKQGTLENVSAILDKEMVSLKASEANLDVNDGESESGVG